MTRSIGTMSARIFTLGTIALVLGVATAGCFSGNMSASPSPSDPVRFSGSQPPVAVAILDSGLTPYHAAFQALENGPAVEDYLTLPGAENVTLHELATPGSWEERRAADAALWAGITPGTLHAFKGTRLFGISLIDAEREGPPPAGVLLLDANNTGHGTATAGVVAEHAPDALIVLVQVDSRFCPTMEDPTCIVRESLPRGMAWAASQPWIDVISVSMNMPANAGAAETTPQLEAFLEASRAAAANGKIVVNSAGNWAAAPTVQDYYAGPPWVIAVGGGAAASRGSSVQSSRVQDVIANFTVWAPRSETVSDYAWTEGTSFSAPTVAATLARAIHHVRSALEPADAPAPASALAFGMLPSTELLTATARDFRVAMNLSTQLLGLQDWDPTQPPSNDTFTIIGGQTAPVLFPGAQAGWGYVTPAQASDIAARVLAADYAIPPEKGPTALYMKQMQQGRETYWSTRNQ